MKGGNESLKSIIDNFMRMAERNYTIDVRVSAEQHPIRVTRRPSTY